jgi:hypothetical protein
VIGNIFRKEEMMGYNYYQKKLKKVASDMLKENTGQHMLDSGGAYGRHWQRNQIRDFEKEPVVFMHLEGDAETGEIKEMWGTYNLYWFIQNFLYLDKDTTYLNTKFRKFATSEKMKREPWEDCLDQFTKKEGGNREYGEYTYNRGSECILSQDIIYDVMTFPLPDDREEQFICLRIHNGCDARGGFTAPYFFKCDDPDYFVIAQSQVTAYCTGVTEALSTEKGDLFDQPEIRCGHCWDSYDGGYSWQDAEFGNSVDLGSLLVYDEEEILTVVNGEPITETKKCLRCKDCGGKIEFYVMESY